MRHMNARVCNTLRFSTGGLGTYFTNQNQVHGTTMVILRHFGNKVIDIIGLCALCNIQVQKFSVNKEETKNLFDSLGKLYQVKLDISPTGSLITHCSGEGRDAGSSKTKFLQRIFRWRSEAAGQGRAFWRSLLGKSLFKHSSSDYRRKHEKYDGIFFF